MSSSLPLIPFRGVASEISDAAEPENLPMLAIRGRFRSLAIAVLWNCLAGGTKLSSENIEFEILSCWEKITREVVDVIEGVQRYYRPEIPFILMNKSRMYRDISKV